MGGINVKGLHLSSGTIFYEPAKQLLLNLVNIGTIRRLEIREVLRSGRESRFYVDCREELDRFPTVRDMLGRRVFDVIRGLQDKKKLDTRRIDQKIRIYGVPNAGKFIAKATVDASRGCGTYSHVEYCETFKEPRTGSQKWVDRPFDPSFEHVLVENAATSGGSLVRFVQNLEEDGYPRERMDRIIFCRRLPNVMQALRDARMESHFVFDFIDIVETLVRLGKWPSEWLPEARDEVQSQLQLSNRSVA